MTTRKLKIWRNSLSTLVICICPKCRREHQLKMFWTGKGIPRIYCHNCRIHVIDNYLVEEPQRVDLTL